MSYCSGVGLSFLTEIFEMCLRLRSLMLQILLSGALYNRVMPQCRTQYVLHMHAGDMLLWHMTS